MIGLIKSKRLLATLLAMCLGTATYGQLSYPSEAFWSDPANVDAFLGTYGVIGPVEPKISTEEQVVLKNLIEILKTGDKQLAVNTLLPAITPESSAALDFTLANLYFELGELDNAIQYYRSSLNKEADFLRAHKNLGILLVQKGQFPDAIGPLSKTLNLGNPDGIHVAKRISGRCDNLHTYVASRSVSNHGILTGSAPIRVLALQRLD